MVTQPFKSTVCELLLLDCAYKFLMLDSFLLTMPTKVDKRQTSLLLQLGVISERFLNEAVFSDSFRCGLTIKAGMLWLVS